MYRFLVLLIVSSFFAAPAWAQEPVDEVDATEAADIDAAEADTAVVEDPEIDETGLDEQGFSDEDDDFRPSEDIPADQSIPFPTDI